MLTSNDPVRLRARARQLRDMLRHITDAQATTAISTMIKDLVMRAERIERESR